MSRLNEVDSNILLTGKDIDFNSTEYSYLDGEFGENPNDYVEVLIHDEEENFIESGIVDKNDYIISTNNDVKLKTGTILRKYGYDRGRYVVKYNFFRKIAGSYENLLVKENQESYVGDYHVMDNGKIMTGTSHNDETSEELSIKENKYLIQEISPSRTELRISAQLIRDRKYLSDFFNLQRDTKLISSARLSPNADGTLKTVSFAGTVGEDLTKSNKINLPIPTTTNMVGGTIYLNDVYTSVVNLPDAKSELDALFESFNQQSNRDDFTSG